MSCNLSWYRLVFMLAVLMLTAHVHAQIHESESAVYQVEDTQFDITDAEMITALIGSSPMPVMANDLDGKERYVGGPAERLKVLWFVDMTNSLSTDYLDEVDNLALIFKDELDVYVFADQSRTELTKVMADRELMVTMFPNGKFLGEAAYHSTLGTPRLFMIDKRGRIADILPKRYFEQSDINLSDRLLAFINTQARQ